MPKKRAIKGMAQLLKAQAKSTELCTNFVDRMRGIVSVEDSKKCELLILQNVN
jgi:hypothetical protein